jgi:hypothetical protein
VAVLAGAAVAWAGGNGPPRGYAAFAAAVPWALATIVVAQYGTSVVTTGAAVVAALLVWIFSLRALRGGRDPAPAGRRAHGSPDELR